MTEFRARTRMIMGLGCIAQRIGDEVAAIAAGPAPIAVIADRGFAEAGLLEPLLAGCDPARVPVAALIGVDPDAAEAEAAGQAARELGAGAVLAIGGGSALCAGKAAAIRLTNDRPLHDYRGRDRLDRLPAPTIAIPTTAGSGSEVSTVVVLHDPHIAQHLVIRGRGYEPEVTLLDGTVLRTLPARPMIDAALDALSHCYEALWARRASPVTDAVALAAARTIRTALPRALEGSEDDMQSLIVASAMANLACGNAEMGLVHALTSAPGVHLPHGYQNGVLLPHVAAFNLPMLPGAVQSEIEELPGFYEVIGFAPRFGDGELSADDAEQMIAAALENPFRDNNARPAAEADLRAVMAAAGAPVSD